MLSKSQAATLEGVRHFLNPEPSMAEQKPRAKTFAEIVAEQTEWDRKWRMRSALVQSITSILDDDRVAAADKADRVAESVRQYVAAGGVESYRRTFVDREDVARICPPCAEKMRARGIQKIAAEALFDRLAEINLPQKTIDALCEKWKDPGFFDSCMEWAADKGLGEGFCAALHKECEGIWPGEHTDEED